ncbi:MAG: alpha/beta hydrolase [Pseudomonadota bacterium]
MTEISRRHLFALAAPVVAAGCVSSLQRRGDEPTRLLVDPDREPDQVIPLWPDGPPGGVPDSLSEAILDRENDFGLRDRAAINITNPTLSVFYPQEPSGEAMLLIPGGGYARVVIDKEGHEGARYFNRKGIMVYVLKYRLPGQGWAAGPDTPLQDAQRAMRLIRARAKADGINAGRVMAIGFSAGGHLCGSLCQRFDTRSYAPVDDADEYSARPDQGVLVYPVALMGGDFEHRGSRVNLIGEAPSRAALRTYDLTASPNPEGPPLFLLHTLDDASVPVENALQLAMAARRASVSAVIHTFEDGGHGFGFRGIDEAPVSVWPQLVLDWFRQA